MVYQVCRKNGLNNRLDGIYLLVLGNTNPTTLIDETNNSTHVQVQ